MSVRVLLLEDFGSFLEISVNFKPVLSLSADISVTISQFRVDLLKLVMFPKMLCLCSFSVF